MRLFDPDIWTQVTGGTIAERVRRLVRVTPLVPAPVLGRRTGADVWLKLESLQRTGSFKLRGAAAFVAGMCQAGKKRIIAASAGNHGLGIALAAGLCGLGQGKATASATEALARNPGARAGIMLFLVLGLAFMESLTLFTLVIVFAVVANAK